MTSQGDDFNLGSKMRLDHLKLLCNNVLLENKGIDEASNIGIRRGQKELFFSKELYI